MRTEIMWIILGMTAVTYLTRISPFILFQLTGVPPWLHRWLKPVPVAMLTALIVPGILMPQGKVDIQFSNHYLVAGVVTILVAYKSRHMVLTLTTGMTVMILLKVYGALP